MSITNFLAQKIQQGDQAALPYLWEQVRDAASTVVRKYPRPASISADDLLQQAYFALLEAVRAYDAERGDFKPLFCFYVRKSCGRALGLYTRHVEEICCLDKPAGDAGDVSIGELIEDESLVPAQDQLERGELFTALYAALEALPEKWRASLVWHDADGLTYAVIGSRLGCSQQNAQRLRDCAIKRLRKDERLARLHRVS